MKTDRCLSLAIGVLLAFFLSFGSVGCLITGFAMDADMAALALVCGLAAVVSALLAGRKWGGVAILCLLTVGIGFFCFSRDAREQLNDLIRWISDFYYRAYGWGWLWQGAVEPDSLGYPLGFLGILVATQASWTVVRREDVFSAVLAALLPLGACLVVTDTVPQVKYLYMLLLGLLLLILTAGMRRSDEHQGNTLTLIAALPLALALGGVFLAVPQESYVNKTEAFYQAVLENFPGLTGQMTENSVTGSTEAQVDLRDVGPLRQRYYPVMDVVAPSGGIMYLRGQDYDLYDGTGWTATPDREEVFRSGFGWMESRGTVTIATLRERECCYVPYYSAADITLTGGAALNSRKDTAYGFAQRTLPENWREMVPENPPVDDSPDSRYLELPEATEKWAKDLLKSILPEDMPLTADKAEMIAAYVRNSAKYDDNTPKMPGDQRDFARWFLTESDTGYCVHFASATAVLLRAAGIPARYVTGYMFRAEAGTPVTVREDRAHAWVEYYEERLGMWLLLESTPAVSDAPVGTEPGQTQTTESQEPTGDSPSEDTIPQEAADPTGTARPEGSGQNPGMQNPIPEEAGEESPDGMNPWVISLIFLMVLMVFVLGQRHVRLARRRKKAASGSYNRRALARWQELELLYRRLGQKPPENLEELAQKARFSQHELTARELKTLDAAAGEARALCGQKPWYQRLVDRYFYAAY